MILVVTPTPPDSPNGNGVTARRWAGILRDLGYRAELAREYRSGDYDLLVALHAVKSAAAVRAFHADHPAAPVVIALTGTDLYPDLETTGVDPAVLALADRLVVLQPNGAEQVPAQMRDRVRVIYQALTIPAGSAAHAPPDPDCFEVAFLAHLRPVKDPLLLAAAMRHLPASSRIRVTHAGEARDPALASEAKAASDSSAAEGRYHWVGPLPRDEALRVLARSRLLAVTSAHEGGANVVTEAIALGVPVISSRIPGSTGLLGADYPGYFRPGDSADLARVLLAAEQDREFYQSLCERCAALRDLADPARERAAWAALLSELTL
ncbi:MAG: TIGR04348 family glycosyltransferase [Streptosporangiaceae bacterium]|nr:TIGR04348 family glycosyltransferase [Streptosporangiaceae bacterium]